VAKNGEVIKPIEAVLKSATITIGLRAQQECDQGLLMVFPICLSFQLITIHHWLDDQCELPA